MSSGIQVVGSLRKPLWLKLQFVPVTGYWLKYAAVVVRGSIYDMMLHSRVS